jgi:hypothetical protein
LSISAAFSLPPNPNARAKAKQMAPKIIMNVLVIISPSLTVGSHFLDFQICNDLIMRSLQIQLQENSGNVVA